MKTIKNDYISEIEINKSRFITLLYRINSVDLVKEKIDLVKSLYKDATHYCYAYVIDDNKKSSDDGEPGGTAGVPIMEVLLKNDLNYVLCVVVRYFGGIKLGAGGLVRAYSKSVSSSLINENITELIPGYEIVFDTSYDNQKNIDYLLKDIKIEKEYLDIIKYKVFIPKDKLNILNNLDYKIIKEIYIEK
ncbi:MAG: YigZ family protein [Bacilli bacterium]|nr:YigZ family protein [Bacilli bacterium]